MPVSSDQQRHTFSLWLRTGRWRPAEREPVEAKYNHWHYPEDGRFTSAGGGRHDGSWFGGGFTGGGGGSFGGGGATSTAIWPDRRPGSSPQRAPSVTKPRVGATYRAGSIVGAHLRAAQQAAPTPAPRPAAPARHEEGEKYRLITRNGYEFRVDDRQRTRLVSGTLYRSGTTLRSSTQQRRAGIPDRKPDDDGGHYIAPRFGGPAEAFNHFAHNANSNRGRYRLIEQRW